MKTLIPALVSIVILWGCNKGAAPAANPQATVTLKDGSTFSGAVTKSSTAEISVQAPTGESRTYPMSQVAAVQYASADQTAAAAPAPAAPAPAPPVSGPPLVATDAALPPLPQPVEAVRTIPAGTRIEVRNNEPIDSETAQPGQIFPGVVSRDVMDTDGRVVIARGSGATLVVRSASGQGKLQGQSNLVVDVAAVLVNGRKYRLETNDFVEKGREGVGMNKRTGEFAGGGAAFGGIIGALAGGARERLSERWREPERERQRKVRRAGKPRGFLLKRC